MKRILLKALLISFSLLLFSSCQKEDESQELDEVFVYDKVDKMPEFPGGQAGLVKYLSTNLQYPEIAQKNAIQGRVICQFVVNKDGSVVEVIVVKTSGDADLDNEAYRVIKAMPQWTPGVQKGKKVRVKYTLPVNFKLE